MARKLVHVERIPIRWGDMDAMGHVNNTVYFRYMEQARISWFDALVPRGKAWKATGIRDRQRFLQLQARPQLPGYRGGEGLH